MKCGCTGTLLAYYEDFIAWSVSEHILLDTILPVEFIGIIAHNEQFVSYYRLINSLTTVGYLLELFIRLCIPSFVRNSTSVSQQKHMARSRGSIILMVRNHTCILVRILILLLGELLVLLTFTELLKNHKAKKKRYWIYKLTLPLVNN